MTRPHPLDQGCPPPWASGWGEDRFGVFVQMGSPAVLPAEWGQTRRSALYVCGVAVALSCTADRRGAPACAPLVFAPERPGRQAARWT